jgi:hypothetical protein
MKFLNLLFKNNLEVIFDYKSIIPQYTYFPDEEYDINYHYFSGFFFQATWMWIKKTESRKNKKKQKE